MISLMLQTSKPSAQNTPSSSLYFVILILGSIQAHAFAYHYIGSGCTGTSNYCHRSSSSIRSAFLIRTNQHRNDQSIAVATVANTPKSFQDQYISLRGGQQEQEQTQEQRQQLRGSSQNQESSSGSVDPPSTAPDGVGVSNIDNDETQDQQQQQRQLRGISQTTQDTATAGSSVDSEPSPDQRQQQLRGSVSQTRESAPATEEKEQATAAMPTPSRPKKANAFAVAAFVGPMAQKYSTLLAARPILTKSITAGCTFFVSDLLAQTIENRDDDKAAINWTRIFASTVIGFLYFGPAAHYWYEMIFRILPNNKTILDVLQKAALGQAFFGPAFTCIFFASSLIQSGNFSIPNWISKIKQDLPSAWLAGASFWPLVDVISYGYIPMNYIPLFVNGASLVWTIYLSLVANRRR